MQLSKRILMIVMVAASSCNILNSPAGTVKEEILPGEVEGFFTGAVPPERHLWKLPAQGKPQPSPWQGHYWPGLHWGLTRRFFDLPQSPLEKFEAAFSAELKIANPGYQPGQLMQFETRRVTGVREGWYGICDGVSEAANFFPEPTQSLRYNNVTFYPFEIKALLGYFVAMSGPSRKFVFAGRRMTDVQANFDGDSRALTRDYRNINPGLFHIVLGNVIGVSRRGVVADITPDHLVLNFPILGYSMLELSEVLDPTEFARLAAFNAAAKKIFKVTMRVQYGDSHRVLEPLPKVDHSFYVLYSYSLELSDSGEIIGGEWLGASKMNHPNFIWMAEQAAIDVQGLATERLEQRVVVGGAIQALLAAPADPDSASQIAALQRHRDNLSPYAMFRTDAVPPVPAQVAPLLDFVPVEISPLGQ